MLEFAPTVLGCIKTTCNSLETEPDGRLLTTDLEQPVTQPTSTPVPIDVLPVPILVTAETRG
jgi:hypothetical protein